MNKNILFLSLGLLCFQMISINAMEEGSSSCDKNKAMSEEEQTRRVGAWLSGRLLANYKDAYPGYRNWKADRYKEREFQAAKDKKQQEAQQAAKEKTASSNDSKEQGTQIAVCLMRAPSSMPVPTKPN